MPETLTEYEAREVKQIAVWKAETPSRLSRPLLLFRKPLNKVMGRVVSGSTLRSWCEQIESFVEPQAGREEIARAAGVADIRELAHHSLEECDRLAENVSVHAQRRAILESAAAAAVGIVGEALYMPMLLGASVRAIRRIGHCYGYTLATDLDRHYVAGVLELAMVEGPEARQQIRERLYRLMHEKDVPPIDLDAVRRELAEDLVLEAMPIVGEVAAIVLDYAFMRRVDTSARRVFQERWLRRRGKVTFIPPAEVSSHYQALSVAWEAAREVLYLGSYGVGFVATFPLVAAAHAAKGRLPAPVVRGVTEGARDAALSVNRFQEGLRAVVPSPAPVAAQPASVPA